MPRRSSHPFDALAERFAQIFADRISAALPAPNARGGARDGATSKLRGRKLDMRCHYPGCKNRSKGAAVQVPVRRASEAAEEGAGCRTGEVGGEERQGMTLRLV